VKAQKKKTWKIILQYCHFHLSRVQENRQGRLTITACPVQRRVTDRRVEVLR